jgi:two-component system sensor histidine kinase HupT/HoxJ
MVSSFAAAVFVIMIFITVGFMVWSIRSNIQMQLIHKLYFACCAAFALWALAMLGIKFTDSDNIIMLYVWDSLTYPGVTLISPLMLAIGLTIVSGAEKIPRNWLLLFVIPVLTNIIVWTNPLHHLHYKVFSVIRSEIVFGPSLLISGAYTYICLVVGTFLMTRFALLNRSRLYLMQSTMYVVGSVVPLAVSVIATVGFIELPITATPLSFIVPLICHYIAIYKLHILDIKPIATQHVLDWISDGYLILSTSGIVISYNQPFKETVGKLFGITENIYIKDCVVEKDASGRTALFNLINAINSCQESQSKISYEQAVSLPINNGEFMKYYYITDITPLIINKKPAGFIVIFKDITQVKKSMQQLQDSQSRMMEQERLAFLGQMMGGLAHNLKTPIMSIAGCVAAVESLVTESEESLEDPEVTTDDYREIYGEIGDWLQKIRESCAYMSDIITAVKGQAANASVSQKQEFTLDELIKRTALLMRHELQSGGCQLIMEGDLDRNVRFSGDINGLIQVLNNLITNAIYSMHKTGGKKIYLGTRKDETHLSIYIKDTGAGIEPRVRERLFREMITSKGTKGTGLGLYISNAVVRGKFGGHMWAEDNPEGGAVFGISIPLESVSISENPMQEDKQNEKE